MPRQVRIEFPGAVYHVMARGDRREDIFFDNADREMFLATLAEACGKHGWRIHAYVLMSNHYHLLLETPQPNLVKGMSWMQGTYTARINARHKLRGHVFGGRYKAIVVQDGEGEYFSHLLNYIHLNPLRAGLVTIKDGLDSYPWSSLSFYRQPPSKRMRWQVIDSGLDALGLRDTAAGRRKFLEELELVAAHSAAERAGLVEIDGQGMQSTLRRGWYFGNEAFCERMLKLADGALKKKKKNLNYHGKEVQDHGEKHAEAIVKNGLRLMKIKESELDALPKSDSRKALIALAAKRETGVPLRWIANRLRMGVTTGISRYAGEAKKELESNRKNAKLYQAIVK
jgi:putative transposase